jgi:hypothetical protein
MQSAQQAGRLRGKAIGALFLTAFGALWLALGLSVRQELDAAALCWIAGFTLVLAAAAVHVMRRAGRPPRTPLDAARDRAFHRINAAQWIVIFLALTLLHRLHLDVYGVSAIAAVVGLHFFPLARLFRNPLHYLTGAALVAWTAGTLWKLPLDSLQGVTALGAGSALWVSAALTLALCALALRRSPFALRSKAA